MIILNGNGLQGGNVFPPPGAALEYIVNDLTFLTSGTFTVPENIAPDPVDGNYYVYLWMCGGGGGAGGRSADTDAPGSGQGGDFICNYQIDVTEYLGQEVPVTIGAGGAAAPANNGNNGYSGGATSFGSFISCAGGDFGRGRNVGTNYMRARGGGECTSNRATNNVSRGTYAFAEMHGEGTYLAHQLSLRSGDAFQTSGSVWTNSAYFYGASGGSGNPLLDASFGACGNSMGGRAWYHDAYYLGGDNQKFCSSGGAGAFGNSAQFSAGSYTGAGGSASYGTSIGAGGSGRCFIKWLAEA